ncbi:MAG: hypothetical protein NUW08_00635 [Candidatus Uhrbacteria bacterium]|nr:hypothetical protein [Candidatus Uhrbacteria bacterium]
MKHLLSKLGIAFGAFVMSASLALPAAAMTIRGGDSFVLPEGETINDDLYVGGGTVILNGNVNGDVFVGGGTVVINGSVSQDVTAGGGNLTVAGEVGDDLRIAGGNVSILNDVNGDVIAGGGNVLVSKDATIDGDLAVGAGTLVMDGVVKRHALLAGGSILINGTLDGMVEIRAEDVRFGSDARVMNKVRVFAPKEARIDEGAQLANGTEFTQVDYRKDNAMAGKDAEKFIKPFLGFLTMLFVLELVGLMIAAGLFASYFKTYSTKLVDKVLDKPWRALFAGFATAVLTPIVAVLLGVTIIGSWLGILLGLGYAFLIAAAKIYAGVVFGAWLWRLGSKGKTRVVDWKSAVIGAFLLAFLGLIPIFGWIILVIAFLMTLGGLYAMTEDRVKQMR